MIRCVLFTQYRESGSLRLDGSERWRAAPTRECPSTCTTHRQRDAGARAFSLIETITLAGTEQQAVAKPFAQHHGTDSVYHCRQSPHPPGLRCEIALPDAFN